MICRHPVGLGATPCPRQCCFDLRPARAATHRFARPVARKRARPRTTEVPSKVAPRLATRIVTKFGTNLGWMVLALSISWGCAHKSPGTAPVVKKLDIQGNHALSDGAIEDKILTTKTGWWPFATKYRFDPVIWSTDLQRIKRLYQTRGYYQAEVVRDQTTPDPPDGVALKLEVKEGQPTRVGRLDVEGLEGLPEERRLALLGELPLAVGRVFLERDWDAAKSLLVTRLRNDGYAQVVVEGVALVDVHTQQAALKLAVRLGPQYRFGEIQIDTGGDNAIAPAWIWDQVRLAIPEGEFFSDEALGEAQHRVQNMGVFAAVKVTAGAPDPDAQRIPVRVETREAPLRTLKLGGGVRIDQIRNEARLVSEWSNRNFRGGMRRLTIHGEAGWAFIPNTYAVATNDTSSQLRQGPIARLQVDFEQPNFLRRPSLRERSSIALNRTLEQTYDDLGGRLVNGVIWQPRASLSIFPSHHLEGDQLNGPPGAGALTAPLTLGCHTTGESCFVWLSYLEEVITWDRRDDALEPREGFYASLSLQQGGGPLLGNFNYYRVLPEIRGSLSFGDDKQLTFAARLKVGELLPTSGNAQDSAVVTRFYGGGSQSMRGFNDRRLSPLLVAQLPPSPGNPNPPRVTLPIGGNGLIDGSFEVRYAVTTNLILAAFYDVGQVTMGRLEPQDFAHVLMAVGFGLRYRTPVGPVRVDFARRLQVGSPPPLFEVDGAGTLQVDRYKVNDSCFGLGGTGGSDVVTDNLCVLHISIGEAF
jgi:translocation and assembly module TamA